MEIRFYWKHDEKRGWSNIGVCVCAYKHMHICTFI